MVVKACVLFTTILCVAYLVNAVREIRLDDVDIHHISNPLIGRAIAIPKSFLDTLVSCHIIFPDGTMFEAYPTSNIGHPNVRFGGAMPPFTTCNVEFIGVGVDFSGVYELLSTVRYRVDNSLSITRQRFNITITMYDGSPN